MRKYCLYCKYYYTIDKKPCCKIIDKNNAYMIVLGTGRKRCLYYEKSL